MSDSSTVQFSAEPPLAIVTIVRPEVRNAVDRPTASALAAAFRRFEDDDDLAVAVLTGAGGTFCAGADLKAVATGRGNRVTPDGLTSSNSASSSIFNRPPLWCSW